MNHSPINATNIIPWKRYTITLAEVWIAFCIATFAMGMFFSHFYAGTLNIFLGILLGILYLFVISLCVKRLIERLSIAALMLLVPIAPLAVLLLVVSLLPIIQKLS